MEVSLKEETIEQEFSFGGKKLRKIFNMVLMGVSSWCQIFLG